jgi:hypothetical protein
MQVSCLVCCTAVLHVNGAVSCAREVVIDLQRKKDMLSVERMMQRYKPTVVLL